jgi:hypothetical protein
MIQAIDERPQRQGGYRIKGNHLTAGMHPGIGAAGHLNSYLFSGKHS